MLVPPAKWNRKRFCSRACLGAENVARMNATRRHPREYAKPPVMLGKDNPMWRDPLHLACKQCGVGFDKPHWRIAHGHSGEFCSFACKTAYWQQHKAGENSPDWVGGPATYRGRGWLSARSAVVKDQSGSCKRCGLHVGDSLPVHHIKPFREFASADLANQRSNLIGLCQPCHMAHEHPQPKHPRKIRRPSVSVQQP